MIINIVHAVIYHSHQVDEMQSILLKCQADQIRLKQQKAPYKIVMYRFNQRMLQIEKQRILPNADNFKLINTVSDCYYNYRKVIKRMPHQNGKLRIKRECFDKFNDIMYKLYHTTECGTDVTFTETVATWACQANSQFIDEQLIIVDQTIWEYSISNRRSVSSYANEIQNVKWRICTIYCKIR
ncbi:Hypothetical_protein [Hexamita inflata]|uniref:Hypothetical_protein n=1 Tax=Hexamita inflata TaxID=28002 RepID=A0AA86NF43_9EUKA|nr:Hypothetical protein HINF_LOCUS5801 [Hexamita inflata]